MGAPIFESDSRRSARGRVMREISVPFLLLACIFSGCASTGELGRGLTVSRALAEGNIAVINSTATAGMPEYVTLAKLPWDASFGTSAIRVKIPGTPYAIPLVNGKVTPVIIKEHPLEVWRLDGMRFAESSSDSITFANRIELGDGKLKLILDGGEIHEIWTLDFNGPKNRLSVSYYNGSGW